MNNFNKPLSQALQRVGCLEGVVAEPHTEDDIGIRGGHVDDYLIVTYLGQLLEQGQMQITIAPEKLDYLYRLLHINKGKESG